jgi:hypothetical protein
MEVRARKKNMKTPGMVVPDIRIKREMKLNEKLALEGSHVHQANNALYLLKALQRGKLPTLSALRKTDISVLLTIIEDQMVILKFVPTMLTFSISNRKEIG